MRRPCSGYLNSSNLLRLRTALGPMPVAEPAMTDVKVHDWRSPHYFNEVQYNRLAAVMSQVAASIGTSLTQSFHRETAVAPASIAQHFAGPLRDLGMAEGRYYLPFSEKDSGCGFLSLTAETARRWVTLLLGDPGSETDASQALSSLEESLLVDLMATLTEAFLAPVRGRQDLHASDSLRKDEPQVQFEPAKEICMLGFAATGGETGEKDEVSFLLPCSLLAGVVGKEFQAARPMTPEELSRQMMEHVQHMPITVTARLGCMALRFDELLDLSRDDILLLDKSLDETIELLVDGRVVFRGNPARAGGRRAVVISQSAATDGQKTAKAATK